MIFKKVTSSQLPVSEAVKTKQKAQSLSGEAGSLLKGLQRAFCRCPWGRGLGLNNGLSQQQSLSKRLHTVHLVAFFKIIGAPEISWIFVKIFLNIVIQIP